MKESFVYILSNKYRTTFYIRVTSNLSKRLVSHHDGTASVFTKKYQTVNLVYFEVYSDINQAIAREKQLKNWRKQWKVDLIIKVNPKLKTLDYP